MLQKLKKKWINTINLCLEKTLNIKQHVKYKKRSVIVSKINLLVVVCY